MDLPLSRVFRNFFGHQTGVAVIEFLLSLPISEEVLWNGIDATLYECP